MKANLWTTTCGRDDDAVVAELLSHPMLVVSPLLGGTMHEFTVVDGRPVGATDDLHTALYRADFRNLDDSGEWLFRGTLCGPGIGDNELELVMPSFFVTQVRNPEGRFLDVKETIDVCQKVALDPDLAFVRIESRLMNIRTLRLLATKAALPNMKPARGILVRPEDRPEIVVRFDNETIQRKDTEQ